MSTIQKVAQRVQALARGYIPQKLDPRFFTGAEALSTKGLSSLNANGRSVSSNRWTGETRIRRTVTEERLLLWAILKECVPRRGQLRLSLDHSTFGCFTLAVFALSAGKGRVLPVWFAIPELLEWLDGERLGFVVRLKRDAPLGVPWVEPHMATTVGEVSLPIHRLPTTAMIGGSSRVTSNQA